MWVIFRESTEVIFMEHLDLYLIPLTLLIGWLIVIYMDKYPRFFMLGLAILVSWGMLVLMGSLFLVKGV